MNALTAVFLALTLRAPAQPASDKRFLYSEPQEGVYIVRDAALADALKDDDKICAAYTEKQKEADKLARAMAHRRADAREKAAVAAEAQKLMTECLNADKVIKSRLAALFGSRAVERLDRASAFEDMAYVRFVPERVDIDLYSGVKR